MNPELLSQAKLYFTDSEDVSNILGINSCISFRFVDFNQENMSTNINFINVEMNNITELVFHELSNKFTDIFESHGKLSDYQAALAINQTVSPIYQKITSNPIKFKRLLRRNQRS